MNEKPNQGPKGARRKLATLDPAEAQDGAAMAVLNEKQKLFVRALFESPKKHGAAVFAARAAGYGTPTSSAQSMASIASRLCSDPKIQDAIQEESRKYVTTLGPVAVRALKNLLDKPGHRDHGRSLGLVMERVMPTQSTHTVKVEHDAGPGLRATTDVLERIAALATRAGIDLSRMPPLIDAVPVSKSEQPA